MEFIDEFIKQYEREFDYYKEASKLAAEICENGLKKSGIRAIVSYRAKDPESLRAKVIHRNTEKNYKSMDDIYLDIFDLSGVRIALYFPANVKAVETYIKNYFDFQNMKVFPRKEEDKLKLDDKKFSGYHAHHFRVKLKNEHKRLARYSDTLIEIQVASVLMHAWAEVEHDLTYKPLHDEASDDENSILDQINGLVISGEIALNLLQKAFNNRVKENGRKFTNHYELSEFLSNVVKDDELKFFEVPIVRTDDFLKFLKRFKIDKPDILKKIIRGLKFNGANISIVDAVIEEVMSNLDKGFDLYKKVLKNNDESYEIPFIMLESTFDLSKFIKSWIATNRFLQNLYGIRSMSMKTHLGNLSENDEIFQYFILDARELSLMQKMRDLYNESLSRLPKSPNHQQYNYIKYIGMLRRIVEDIEIFGSEEKMKIDVLRTMSEIISLRDYVINDT